MSEQPLPASRAEALALIDQWWPIWTHFIDELDARGVASEPGREGWTAAEVVAHVARWQARAVTRLGEVVAGGRLAELDIDKQNAEWAALDRGIDLAAARALNEASHAALREAVAAVPEDGWRRVMGMLVVANTSGHYQEHMEWRASE